MTAQATVDIIETIRYDNFNLDDVKLTKTDEGYLEGYAVATRTGVFHYLKADGSIQRELRLPEEVFKDDAINSFKMLPITDDHPDKEVTAENAKNLAVGFTGEDIQRHDSYLLTKLKITDKYAIQAINSGKRGLSYGYKVTLVKQDGVYNGEQYDYIQKDIRGNHLAIVFQPRAGQRATMKLDSQEAICVESNNYNKNVMEIIKLDGNEYQVEKKIKDNVIFLQTKVDSLEKEVDSLKGERDSLKEKINEVTTKNDSNEIFIKVKERISLEKKASDFLKADEDTSQLSDKNIKTKVICSLSPEFKPDDKSDEYINARFDAIIDMKDSYNLGKNMNIANKKKDSEFSDVDLSNEQLQRSLINRSNSN